MSKNNKNQNLSWDDFIKLGNPENAPEEPAEKPDETTDLSHHVVRIFLEKKHRGGKTASVIRGIDEDDDYLKALAKKLKQACGVGGNAKNGEIVIQGNQRDKIKAVLLDEGFKNVKLAGG